MKRNVRALRARGGSRKERMKRYGKEVHLYVLKRVQNNLVPTYSMEALKTEYTAELMLKRERATWLSK